MATIAQFPALHNMIAYYAHYGDMEGLAYQMAGGFVFQAEGATPPEGCLTVSTTDPELVLHGRTDVADAQRQADGDRIANICGRS